MNISAVADNEPPCTCADWGMMGCLSTCEQEVWRRKQAMKTENAKLGVVYSPDIWELREKAEKLGIRTDRWAYKILSTYVSAADLIEDLNEICKKEDYLIELKDITISIEECGYNGPELQACYYIPQTIDELKTSIQNAENALEQRKNEEYQKFLELQKKFSLTPMEE